MASLTRKLKHLITQMVHYVDMQGAGASCVNAIISHDPQAVEDLKNCNDPSSYFNFLVDCLVPCRYAVKVVKSSSQASTSPDLERFNALLNALKNKPQILPYPLARPIGLAADRLLGNYDLKGNRDVSSHFKSSSSFASKGCLLATIIRHMRPELCLELGTAYGMSGLFILSMLKQLRLSAVLHTVEMTSIQYNLSSQILKEAFGEQVHCHQGTVQKVLPEILDSANKVDFVFHDAGHSHKDYTEDFALMQPFLKEGAVVLFDDICWTNSANPDKSTGTYKGWQEVINHPCVKRAVEINKAMGLILL